MATREEDCTAMEEVKETPNLVKLVVHWRTCALNPEESVTYQIAPASKFESQSSHHWFHGEHFRLILISQVFNHSFILSFILFLYLLHMIMGRHHFNFCFLTSS